MQEVHLIPGGVPAQELVDSITEAHERRRERDGMERRLWAIREQIIYWGTIPSDYRSGVPGRTNTTAGAVLVWAKDRGSLHNGGNVAATLRMNAASDLVLSVSIDGDTGYTSVRDLLDVLQQLAVDAVARESSVTDVRVPTEDDSDEGADVHVENDLDDLPF